MNVFIKLIVFLTAATAVGGIVTDGLVLHMEASSPGADNENFWKPIVGPADGGVLRDLTDPALGELSHRPFLIVEPSHYAGFDKDGFVWFYRFTYTEPVEGVHDGGGGLVGDIGDDVVFNYDEDYTVDFWYRYPQSCSEKVGGKGWLFSADNGSGFRFNTRSVADGSGYFFELVHIYNKYENSYNVASGMPVQEFNNMWHHVLIVHDGTAGEFPTVQLWIDGVLVVDRIAQCTYNASKGGVCPPNFLEFNTLPDAYSDSPAAIGGRCDGWTSPSLDQRYWWAGDLAALRVYDRCLSANEIQQNYDSSVVTVQGYSCGGVESDINDDCIVDFYDLVILCENWMRENWIFLIFFLTRLCGVN